MVETIGCELFRRSRQQTRCLSQASSLRSRYWLLPNRRALPSRIPTIWIQLARVSCCHYGGVSTECIDLNTPIIGIFTFESVAMPCEPLLFLALGSAYVALPMAMRRKCP